MKKNFKLLLEKSAVVLLLLGAVILDFYLPGKHEQSVDYAWIWLIPAIVVGVGAIIAVTSGNGEPVAVMVAVVGHPASGKTSFVHFIKYGKLPEQYRQTMRTGMEKVVVENNFTFNIYDSKSHIEGSLYAEEKELIEKCDYILYFFKVNDIMEKNERAIRLLSQEAGFIVKHIHGSKKNPKKIIAIGTHCDLLKGINERQIRENEWIQELEQNFQNTGIYGGTILGALNTEEEAKKIKDELELYGIKFKLLKNEK
jgi:hypothetical protein